MKNKPRTQKPRESLRTQFSNRARSNLRCFDPQSSYSLNPYFSLNLLDRNKNNNNNYNFLTHWGKKSTTSHNFSFHLPTWLIFV